MHAARGGGQARRAGAARRGEARESERRCCVKCRVARAGAHSLHAISRVTGPVWPTLRALYTKPSDCLQRRSRRHDAAGDASALQRRAAPRVRPARAARAPVEVAVALGAEDGVHSARNVRQSCAERRAQCQRRCQQPAQRRGAGAPRSRVMPRHARGGVRSGALRRSGVCGHGATAQCHSCGKLPAVVHARRRAPRWRRRAQAQPAGSAARLAVRCRTTNGALGSRRPRHEPQGTGAPSPRPRCAWCSTTTTSRRPHRPKKRMTTTSSRALPLMTKMTRTRRGLRAPTRRLLQRPRARRPRRLVARPARRSS